MAQSSGYDLLLNVTSGVVLLTFTFGIILETDLLPPHIRQPLRSAIHEAGYKAARLPGVREVHDAFQ